MSEPATSLWTRPPTLMTPGGTVSLENTTPVEVTPRGHMVLIEMYTGEGHRDITREDGTKTTLYLADQTRENQKFLAQVGKVLEIGPDAYVDKDRFPSGARCEVGQWVIIGRYAGAKVDVKVGKGTIEYRLLNDDEILAVISDPAAIKQYVG